MHHYGDKVLYSEAILRQLLPCHVPPESEVVRRARSELSIWRLDGNRRRLFEAEPNQVAPALNDLDMSLNVLCLEAQPLVHSVLRAVPAQEHPR